MRLELRGPDAIVQRMNEIAARMGALNPEPVNPTKPEPTARADSFASTLQGEIGMSANSGLAPMRPMGIEGIGTPIQSLIERVAKEEGIDAHLLNAVVMQESAYDPNARSHKGAMGLMQLMPGTARMLGVTDPMDPEQNLRGGAKYLKGLLSQHGGDIPLAVASYNAGPGNVRKYGGIPPFAETQAYVQKIMDRYGMVSGGGMIGR